jgi:hypothetical protein
MSFKAQGYGYHVILLELDPERRILVRERWVNALEGAATRCVAVCSF